MAKSRLPIGSGGVNKLKAALTKGAKGKAKAKTPPYIKAPIVRKGSGR